ncbi:MAG: hypothetical protein A2V78_02470 [Betaproteobacteria bacterium RBG_16_64_18]|nr:MAG: hypothetical protein A2V78_02470 [Betaproteobacteria bacterium RBG_16_64_18]
MKMQGVGVAWFKREDWPRWLAMDANFQPDYQHWLRRMEAVFTRYQAAGVPVVKVTLDPDEFIAWSRATGAGVGTDARAGYAALKARTLDHGRTH